MKEESMSPFTISAWSHRAETESYIYRLNNENTKRIKAELHLESLDRNRMDLLFADFLDWCGRVAIVLYPKAECTLGDFCRPTTISADVGRQKLLVCQ